MASTGTIIGFPSGKVRGPAGPDTVSGIAEKLHRKLGRRRPRAGPSARLVVSLEAVCGVADETIRRLSTVAAAGSVTPETAVRLALRHAREIGTGQPSRSTALRGVPGVYDLHISGDGIGSFAVRIASADNAPWIGSAALPALDRLLGVCPDGRAICLLVGRAEAAGRAVRLVTTPSWKTTLVGRSMRPGWQALRHLLVICGLPSGTRERSDVAAAIAHHLRAQPHLTVSAKQADVLRPAVLKNPTSTGILRLLAVALPGLLHPDHGGGLP